VTDLAPAAAAPARSRRIFARHTGILGIGQILRALSAAALFVLGARVLGADGFGVFVSVAAVSAVIVPFGSLGSINLMMRHIAIHAEDAAVSFTSALVITVGSGALFVSALAAVQDATGLLNTSAGVVLLVASADLLAYRLAELSGAARQAQDWMYGAAFFPVALNVARVVALAVVSTAGPVSLFSFAVTYFAASALTAAAVVMWTLARLGLATPRPAMFLSRWREGLHFSVGLASQTVYNDVDKVMLARLASDASAGVYASAYRAIDLACVPLRALFGAAYIRYFRAGTAGLSATLRVARGLLVPSLAAASASALLLLATAGLLPLLLGPEFDSAVGVTRWLAVIPVLRALHYLPADSLTGAGMQGIRTACQLGIAVLNVLLNVVLIPTFGISGAVASSIATDALLACALWAVVAHRLRRRVLLPSPRGAAK